VTAVAAFARAHDDVPLAPQVGRLMLVPWKRDDSHKSRSAAPGWRGAKSEHIGHM